MDPNACFCDLVTAFRQGEWEECLEHAENLLYWINKGGFSPSLYGVDPINAKRDHLGFARVVRQIARAQLDAMGG